MVPKPRNKLKPIPNGITTTPVPGQFYELPQGLGYGIFLGQEGARLAFAGAIGAPPLFCAVGTPLRGVVFETMEEGE